MTLPIIDNADKLEALVQEIGFLPFFASPIEGFSLEAITAPGHWFEEGVEGPWEWRETVAARGHVAYAKLFGGKAGFVSKAWYPALANYRRDGYDFDARFEDGLATLAQKLIMDRFLSEPAILSTDLRKNSGVTKGFESALGKLQMQTYLTVREFVHRRDRYGLPYGWGIGRYTTPEALWGDDFIAGGYSEEPALSKQRIADHMETLWPSATGAQIHKLIR